MQTQPRPHRTTATEVRRVRQAAMTADDTFKGGDQIAPRSSGTLRSPWHFASGHLWEAAGRRRSGPG